MKRSKLQLTFGLALACAALTFSLAVCAQAQTLTYFAQFNAAYPYGSLVQATDGNFYGAANLGTYPDSDGIFQITPSGQITSIYTFCSQPDCADGQYTTAPILGSDGNLYGVSLLDGKGGAYGWSGELYRLTLDGQLTTLYTFCPSANCVQGQIPNGIIQGSDGNFYGTTSDEGTNQGGTIFQVSSTGKFKLLYSFCGGGCAGGGTPLALPMQGSDGNFYGTALSYPEAGVVYKFTPSGSYKVIHTFCIPCYGGGNPVFSGLVEDAQADLFSATIYAANSYNSGTVFEITPTHQYSVLHAFRFAGGVAPRNGLTLANDGNLYGVAVNDDFDSGGNYSILYEVTPAGEYTTLYTSYNLPNGPILQGTDGSFYGTTEVYSLVFKLSNGLSPFVRTVPIAGNVGQSVIILGNDLTGTTSVTFNGVAAKFTVESDTYIKAAVPAGATTGIVSVVTPSGTLNSNPQFVVTK